MTLRDDATLREALNGLSPRLRRYARALATGQAAPSDLADELVHATLMRALGARHVGAAGDLAIRLYATVTQLHREFALSGQRARAAGEARPSVVSPGARFPSAPSNRLSGALLRLPLELREALLLVALEGFDYADASRILRISRNVLFSRLTQARMALDAALREEDGLHSAPAHPGSGNPTAGIMREGPAKARNMVPYLRLVT